MVFCDIGDEVSVSPADDLSLRVDGPFADATGRDNIVMRAGHTLRDRHAIEGGAEIHLTKNLPVAAGLGGGSSDAAAALTALCRLWEIDDPEATLQIAAGLGTDVPACLTARSVVVGGAGDQIVSEPAVPSLAMVLINPGAPVATADAYARCAPSRRQIVTDPEPPTNLAALVAWLDTQSNDLTTVATEIVPEIETRSCLPRSPADLWPGANVRQRRDVFWAVRRS